LLQLFLTTKYHVNDEYVKHYADKWFDKMRNIGQDKSKLGQGVEEMGLRLEQKFRDGYGNPKDPFSIRSRFHEKYTKSSHGSDQAKGGNQGPGGEDGKDQGGPTGCQPTNQAKFKDVLCYEELGKEYVNSMLENDKG